MTVCVCVSCCEVSVVVADGCAAGVSLTTGDATVGVPAASVAVVTAVEGASCAGCRRKRKRKAVCGAGALAGDADSGVVTAAVSAAGAGAGA